MKKIYYIPDSSADDAKASVIFNVTQLKSNPKNVSTLPNCCDRIRHMYNKHVHVYFRLILKTESSYCLYPKKEDLPRY